MNFVLMSVLGKITESGVSFAEAKSEKRNIVLTNYISLVAAGATLVLLTGRYVFANVNTSIAFTLLLGSVLFLLPVLLNRLGFTDASRLILCWLPALYQLTATLQAMSDAPVHETSNYVGLRFFILAFSCFPFLVFDIKKERLFIPGLLGPLLSILLYDPILNFFGLGYSQMGLHESTYEFNNVRIFVSFLIIGSSSFFLKRQVEQNQELNDRLSAELAEKNALLQQEAKDEVHNLNQRLLANLEQLAEREFILNQSQRIARIGSWEYRVADGYIFWSDEMYNIFGLDKDFDLKTNDLSGIMWGEQSQVLIDATHQLLQTGQPIDLTLRARTPLGYKKWIRVYAFPVFENQHVTGVRSICHDITYYKEAEEQLRTTEQKFSKAFQHNPDLMTILREKDLVIFDVNEKIETVMGYRREELLGQAAAQFNFFVKDEERKLFFEQYSTNGKAEIECSWRKKDGKTIQVLLASRQMELEGEKYLLSIIKDISDRKLAEERFQKSFDLNPDLMLIFRERDRVLVEANSKLESLAYYKRENVIGRSSTEFRIWINPEEQESHNQEYATAGTAFREALLRKNGGEVFYASITSTRILFSGENHILVQVRDITDKKLAEEEKEEARYSLNERIKELTTLYKASQILQQEKKPVEELIREIVSILPSGWQYPEITAARIALEEMEFVTPNYASGFARQSQEFDAPGDTVGIVEIVYLEKKRSATEGPFLAEERDLINMIAEMLRAYFAHRHEAEELNKSQANLHATINNTEILIWSVDRNFRLLTYNQPFFKYIKTYYGVEIEPGTRILEPTAPETATESKGWEQNYLRALAGEIVTLEESRFGLDLLYSLSPIIESNHIIGVSVFGDNITEKKARDRELAEANKKVGELKLMALRSVMSPHFIFNVLNSIQFFIAKNDRLNAINYLSTFSKLIRSILTHSVTNKIKLAEEIEMLKNYVQLEMTRFENKFNFILQVDPEVDVDGIEIPSLLIQPYVENAILHGLYNKTDPGTLVIRVHEQDEAVIFEIEDNGVGRKEAMKLRQQNFPTHKSMGIKLTEERLKLINQQHHAAFEIEDLFKGKRPAGTKVRIRVTF